MPAFVFLEITDRNLNFLFAAIAQAVYGERPAQPTHLTIRGPYAGRVPRGVVSQCRSKLEQDVLRIADVGRFNNTNEEVVFLRVDSPNLRRVWWKPDYPIGKFGFNPHISLYRGKDFALAEALELFFKHEGIELFCAEFRLVSAVTRQQEMLVPPVPVSLFPFHSVLDGKISENFLSRLDVVITRVRRRSAQAVSERPKEVNAEPSDAPGNRGPHDRRR